MSLSFPSIWVPGNSFILASCLIGKEAISSILLDQWAKLIENLLPLGLEDDELTLINKQPEYAKLLTVSGKML